jgi:hypothetical protein
LSELAQRIAHERLAQILVRHRHRTHEVGIFHSTRHAYAYDAGKLVAHLRQQRRTVHLRHAQVTDDGVELAALEGSQCRLAGIDEHHVVMQARVTDLSADLFERERIVIHEQQPHHATCSEAWRSHGSRTRNTVPLPTVLSKSIAPPWRLTMMLCEIARP